MDPNPILAFFHLVLTLILIHHIHHYVCANDYRYANCSHTFDCSGHVNLTYPFWGSNRPSYCGHPEFELNCTKNIPLITIESVDFRVLELNQKNNTLVVARDDYWELSTCPKEFRNTTLGSSVFNFSSDSQSLTVYYHCPQPKMATNVYYRTDTVNGTVTSSVLDTVVVNGTATPTTTPTVVVANGTATPTATPTVVVANGTATPTATPTVVANGTANASVEQNNLFKCYKNGEEWSNYFFTEATKGNLTGGINAQTCDETMILRISNSVDGGITRNISTSLVSALRTGFGLNWKLNVSSSCDECKASGGYCGSHQNEGQFFCYCVNGPERFKCRHGLHVDLNLLIGLSVGSFIIISIVIIYIIWRKKKETGTSDVEKLIKNFGSFAPKRYSYFNVKKITNSFTERIGKGGFGTVYKGKLPDGRLVAVKLLSCSMHNGQDFINEVASISRCSHVNIVNFFGFCYEGNKRALIYEYMSNGSLDNFIFGDKGCLITNRRLQWTTLYEITIGIARGIQYLHRGCNTGILHFDIKPENILLDETLCPKISDFGLAKLWPRKESIVSMIETRGTMGYIAPEVYNRNFGAVSHKSDVYSYGMVVLEIVGGRKNVDVGVSHVSQIYYPYWIYEDIELGNDLRIEGIISEEDKEIAKKMILVSFWCIQTRPSDRPSMSKVVDMLEGSLESLMIPPKPVLCSPERPNQEPTSH